MIVDRMRRTVVQVGQALGQRAAVGVVQLSGDDAGGFLIGGHRRGQRVAQHMRVSLEASFAGEGSEAAAGVVGVERGAPLGPKHQVQLHGAGRLAWLDPPQGDSGGLDAGQPQAGLLAAVLPQRLHGEAWQAEDGLAGLGLDRPDGQLLPPAICGYRAAGEQVGLDDGQLLAEADGALVEVEVGPFQAAQLAVAGAGGGRQHGPGPQPRLGVGGGGVQQQVDLFGEQRGDVLVGDGGWGGVLGGVVVAEPPGDRLSQRAVQAAVDGQDVLRVQPARLAVFSPSYAELVVDALHLQRLQPGQELVADVGAHVVGQQAAVAGDGAGAADGADVGQPAVQVLVDGEPVRLQPQTVADGGPVHSFATLLADLATIAASRIQPADGLPAFTVITTPTPVQRQALQLLGVNHRPGYTQSGSIRSARTCAGRRSTTLHARGTSG